MSDHGFFETKHDDVAAAVRKMAANTALMYYHLTRAAYERFGDSVKDTIGRGVYHYGFDRGARIAEKVKSLGEPLTMENLDRYYDIPIAQGFNPQTRYDGKVRRNVTESCTYADVWKEKGWEEIGHLYCIQDCAVRAGYNPCIQFRPKRNLLLGDDCCESVTVYLDRKDSGE